MENRYWILKKFYLHVQEFCRDFRKGCFMWTKIYWCMGRADLLADTCIENETFAYCDTLHEEGSQRTPLHIP